MTNMDKPKRIERLMPEVKIKTVHKKTASNVWPISGCIINNNEIKNIIKTDNKYSVKRLELLLLERILANITIKKGFTTSIGWNLGKKNRSIHLFDPLTSIPIIGTKESEIKDIKNRIIEYLNNLSLLRDEKTNIKSIPIPT